MFHRRTTWFACIAIAIATTLLALRWTPAWWWLAVPALVLSVLGLVDVLQARSTLRRCTR